MHRRRTIEKKIITGALESIVGERLLSCFLFPLYWRDVCIFWLLVLDLVFAIHLEQVVQKSVSW